jgi:hypothetical protein
MNTEPETTPGTDADESSSPTQAAAPTKELPMSTATVVAHPKGDKVTKPAKIAKTAKKNDSYAKALASRTKTMLERTGGMYSNVSQLPGFGDKCRQTSMEKRGYAHANQAPENRKAQSKRMTDDNFRVIRKGRDTIRRLHGVDNPMQIPGIVAKQEARCLAKRGVRHHMQDLAVFTKVHKSLHRIRSMEFNGKQFNVQGYEEAQIRYLDSIGFDVNNMVQDLPPIRYQSNGKSHAYYPDLFVKSGNRVLAIETKSAFTAWESKRKLRTEVKAKAKAAIKEHRNFLMLVFDGREAKAPVGFYLVKSGKSRLRYSVRVNELPKLLRVFM